MVNSRQQWGTQTDEKLYMNSTKASSTSQAIEQFELKDKMHGFSTFTMSDVNIKFIL